MKILKKYLVDLLRLFDPDLEEDDNERIFIMCFFFGLILVGFILFQIFK